MAHHWIEASRGDSMMTESFDFCVIGGGIAGLSVAAMLAEGQKVAVIEREAHLSYHATGRSAAIFAESYGNRTVQALTRASKQFYFEPPSDFVDAPVVTDRGVLFIAQASQRERLLTLHSALAAAGSPVVLETGDAARSRVPVLRDAIAEACYDPDACDLDVGAIVGGFRRLVKARGGAVFLEALVARLRFDGHLWHIEAGGRSVCAPIVVNAAGAWADEIARLAGVPPLGLRPLRRTVAIVELTTGPIPHEWPFVVDVDERFYFKPEAAQLLISPADETLSIPCDAFASDLDVAEAVDRIESATTLTVSRVTGQWAGLRTFAADRTPVIGFDSTASGFFWVAGQGGFGIQTAPAAARCAAALVQRASLPAELSAAGVRAQDLSPDRFPKRIARWPSAP